MVVVAVVGGTGNVGKTIVDAFKEDGKHEVIVLARKAPEGETAVPTFAVDYNNIDQLTKILEDNKVHTVISTVLMYDPTSAQSERNVIAAAEKSSVTKRFVQSNWGDRAPEDKSLWIGPNALREQNLEVLRQTNLEWTQFHNGLFLDYYGIPHVESYLTPLVFAVDIANRKAAIPGDKGDELLSFTYTKDLGKFVVAALSLSKWDEALYCYSDQLSMKEIVQLAEEATGTKFDVTYDSVEKLRSGQITELPSHEPTYQFFPKEMLQDLLAKFGLWVVYGIMYRPKTGSLNEKFPKIKITTAKEIVGAWKGK
jgi:nucleoside-diphosphate-sugar epimerase